MAFSFDICSIKIALNSILSWLYQFKENLLKKIAALSFGHLCFVQAKQHQAFIVFHPHIVSENRGKLPKIV